MAPKDDCPWKWEELRQLCKHEHIPCSGNKAQLCERLTNHMSNLKNNSKDAKKGVYAPEKYLAGLSPKEREKRIKELRKGAKTSSDDPDAYKPSAFSTDFDPKTGKRKKTKTSSYTSAFKDLYPNATSLEEKSKATGVPKNILQQVYDKGLAAYRTGHRPGATQGQWASARVNSFLMKGCTYYFPDHKLVEEAKKKSPKAREHWKKVNCICKKGCKIGKK